MKRVYWSIGSAVVLFGLWFLVSLFGEEETKASRKTEDRGVVPLGRPSEALKIEPPTEAPKVEGREAVGQDTAVLYASTLPQSAVPESEVSEELSVDEQVTLLRKPVITAIRLLNVSNEEKYDRMREALHDSGDSVEEWTRQASGVFVGWHRLLNGKGGAELDALSVRCYLAGCEGQVYFKSEAQYEEAAKAFRTLTEANAGHGGRVQTPPKQLEDGRWVAAWLMLRPNVGVE